MPTLKWKRPVEVAGHTERHSHCGRYKIEKREYCMPFASVGYVTFKKDGDGWKKVMKYESDTLVDAKYWAEADLDPNYEGV